MAPLKIMSNKSYIPVISVLFNRKSSWILIWEVTFYLKIEEKESDYLLKPRHLGHYMRHWILSEPLV